MHSNIGFNIFNLVFAIYVSGKMIKAYGAYQKTGDESRGEIEANRGKFHFKNNGDQFFIYFFKYK